MKMKTMIDLTQVIDLSSIIPMEEDVLYAKYVVSKPLFDEIRRHQGIYFVMSKEYELISFGTEYISEGYPDFTITLRLKLRLTKSQLREDRFKELLD